MKAITYHVSPGMKFNMLTLVEPRNGRGRPWLMRCDCGNLKVALASEVATGRIKSCGCLWRNKSDAWKEASRKRKTKHNFLPGTRFGVLTILSKEGERYTAKCDCGNITKARGTYLASGRVKSCGCLMRKAQKDWNETQREKARLENKYKITEGGCWEWTSYKNACGYGTLRIDGRSQLAHRASYEQFIGHIPEGLNVNHKCDNPACINPEHLWIGTQLENIADMVTKGRQVSGPNNPKRKIRPTKTAQRKVMTEMRHLARSIGVSLVIHEGRTAFSESGR
jgi:hypothetical protein